MSESDRRDALKSWIDYAATDTGEALTDVENALKRADGLTRERLLRARSSLIEALQHLDTVYPDHGLHSVSA